MHCGDTAQPETIQPPLRYTLPPSLKSQYDIICDAISQGSIFLGETVSIIAMYALLVGYDTNFRKRWITYTCNDDSVSPTIATYKAYAPDWQNALLDFSFRGRCKIRFKIHEKGDEMWLGVVGDPLNLMENKVLHRGRGLLWSFYCGRELYHRPEPYIKPTFKPKPFDHGVRDSMFGSLHFPGKYVGRLFPGRRGDVVDLEVNAQAKTFQVILNGVLQRQCRAPKMPDQLSFWVLLDNKGDRVEFEILDFNFEKRNLQVGEGNAADSKYVELPDEWILPLPQ